jgi:hypothetical protein
VAEQLSIWGFQDFAAGAESLYTYTQDPRLDPTSGTLVYAIPFGVGTPAQPGLRGQTVDGWAVGYNRRLGRGMMLSLTAMRRAVRRVLSAGLDTLGTYIWGNPGEGAMAQFPKQTRTYNALEATLERSGTGAPWFRVSYVLSRTRGNYPGLYGSDWRLGITNGTGPMYILPEQHVNGEGLLPNDRTHVLKAYGAHEFSFGLNAGASLIVTSGTPLSEYGAIVIPPPFRGFASQRGTSGRTPTIWDLGMRLSYRLPIGRQSTLGARVLLDIQRLGSPRKLVDRDQWHYTCLADDGSQSCPNANYGRVAQFQQPMMARLGIVVDLGREH